MGEIRYQGRRALQLENESLRVVLTVEGGHVAEIRHKPSGVNPLWQPPWPTIEPSQYDPLRHPEYGAGPEAKLLAGIKGHNLCLDLFGAPSEAEATAGMTAHGEASINVYDYEFKGDGLVLRTTLQAAQLGFERVLRLDADKVHFRETVQNLSALDRPIAWTQHVSLGEAFLEPGKTTFDLTATRSRSYESDFGNLYDTGVDFDWPHAGGFDLRSYPDKLSFAGYSAHLMDPSRTNASFTCYSPEAKLAFSYRWLREDFPWCGIWDEHCFRSFAPWNGRTIARGMEFGVSPMPETRRRMIERGSLFGVPAYRWIAAKQSIIVAYEAQLVTVP